MGAHPAPGRRAGGLAKAGWAPMAYARSPMCKVKGCERSQFVAGLCGFHALQGYYRTAGRGAPRLRPVARIRIAKTRPVRQPAG